MVRTTSELLSEIPKLPQRVCFTGGEPLNQNLKDLALSLVSRGQIIHVETSGTVIFPPWMAAMRSDNLWLTVSPKAPLLLEQLWFADEIKLLVDAQFNLEEADRIAAYVGDRTTIWIQPINTEWELDRSNLAQCLALLQQRPMWRLSSQMHKIWKVR
jgi:organic radical activating enzyme